MAIYRDKLGRAVYGVIDEVPAAAEPAKEKQAKAEYGATGHGAETGYGAWMGTEPGYGNGFENGYGTGAGPEKEACVCRNRQEMI